MNIEEFLNPSIRPEIHLPVGVAVLISRSNFCTDFLKEHFPNHHNHGLQNYKELESSLLPAVAKAYDYMFKVITSTINSCNEFGFKLIDSVFESATKKLEENNQYTEKVSQLRKHLSTSKELVKKYRISQRIDLEVIAAFIFLDNFHLENPYARSFLRIPDVRLSYETEVNQLWDLYSSTDWTRFKAKERFLQCPNFSGHRFITGAGDILVDDTLIEVKTTRYNKIKRSDLNQVILYSFIEVLDQKERYDPKKIYKVGLYYSRTDYLHVFDKYFGYNRKEFLKLAEAFSWLVYNNYSSKIVEAILEQRELYRDGKGILSNHQNP
ncbi:MAG: hypothetical protein RIC35_14790 [Marinoscillum sp.]